MIAHTPIRSVRTFFLWKLTAMTDLQMGHLILIMPSTASGSASNNLLFLQHGQATCTYCISFRLPQEANVKLTVGNCFIFLCTVCRDLNPMVAINIVYRTYVLMSINLSAIVVSGFPDEVMIFTNSLFPVCEPIILRPSRIHHGARCRDKSPVFRHKNKPGTTVSPLFQAFHPTSDVAFYKSFL